MALDRFHMPLFARVHPTSPSTRPLIVAPPVGEHANVLPVARGVAALEVHVHAVDVGALLGRPILSTVAWGLEGMGSRRLVEKGSHILQRPSLFTDNMSACFLAVSGTLPTHMFWR